MSVLIIPKRNTLNCFLNSSGRSSTIDGRMEMMAGALAPHNDIVTNMMMSLGRNTNNCKPHNSDQAIRIPKFHRYICPGLSFSRGGPGYDSNKKRCLLNPALVVEVISNESEYRDKEKKFNWYFSLPGVKEYILISSLRKEVKSYLRKCEKTWIMQSL